HWLPALDVAGTSSKVTFVRRLLIVNKLAMNPVCQQNADSNNPWSFRFHSQGRLGRFTGAKVQCSNPWKLGGGGIDLTTKLEVPEFQCTTCSLVPVASVPSCVISKSPTKFVSRLRDSL